MSFLTVSTYQIALAAILPKQGAGITAEALAVATNFSIDLVRTELNAMVEVGEATFNTVTGEYHARGDRDGGQGS